MSRQKTSLNPAFVVVIVASILLIVSLIKNAVGLYQSRSRLETAAQTVAQLESKKQTLAEDINLRTDPASTDQIIRDQLNLVLPGDTMVVITGTESSESSDSSESPLRPPTPQLSPLLQWWHLFNP